MIVIGTFIRGPGWMWFWPGQTWDASRVDFAVNRNLDQDAVQRQRLAGANFFRE